MFILKAGKVLGRWWNLCVILGMTIMFIAPFCGYIFIWIHWEVQTQAAQCSVVTYHPSEGVKLSLGLPFSHINNCLCLNSHHGT